MAAEQAQKLADRKVLVLPTRTVPQGMTAMLNFDPEASAEDNAINMNGGCREGRHRPCDLCGARQRV